MARSHCSVEFISLEDMQVSFQQRRREGGRQAGTRDRGEGEGAGEGGRGREKEGEIVCFNVYVF